MLKLRVFLKGRGVAWLGISLLVFFSPQPFSANAATLAGHCNPVRVYTCSLPFPSDLFTEESLESPTGLRVVIPNDVFELFATEDPQNPVDLVPSVRPESLFANSSGFSAAAPVMFELDRAIDESTLPLSGGTSFQVYEIGGNGEPVPVRAGIMSAAQSSHIARHDVVIEAWPRSRWQYGARYVAVVTNDLKPLLGEDYQPSLGLQDALWNEDSDLGVAHEDALAFLDERLEALGKTRQDVVAATFFTVREEAETQLPLANLVQKVYAEEHQMEGWRVEHHAFKYQAVTVHGRVRLSNYRKDDGDIILDAAYPGDDNWVEFQLVIPNGAADDPAPVVVYGHGLSVEKETMSAVAQLNAARNIATIAIDQPNHGTRIESDGGYLLSILQPEHLQRVIGLIAQSSLDLVSLVAAIEQNLHRINALPHHQNDDVFPWLGLYGTDGIPDLDTSRIYYEGTSMGGVLGSAFLGLSPKLDAGFLQVAGVGITNVLTHSVLWSEFQHLAPPEVVGAELAAFIGMVQQRIDYGDGINFIHHSKHGSNILPYYFEPYPLTLVYGHNDGVVYNGSSIALSEIAGLPMAEPATDNLLDAYDQWPLEKLPQGDWFDKEGNGVRLIQPATVPIAENSILGWLFGNTISQGNALLAHMAFIMPAAQEYQKAWTETYLMNPQP